MWCQSVSFAERETTLIVCVCARRQKHVGVLQDVLSENELDPEREDARVRRMHEMLMRQPDSMPEILEEVRQLNTHHALISSVISRALKIVLDTVSRTFCAEKCGVSCLALTKRVSSVSTSRST